MDRPRVLAIAAHPDDIEFVMAGTLLHLQNAGYRVHCINVANGCCGSTEFPPEELVRIRWNEAQQSALLGNFELHPSLTNDLEVIYDVHLLKELAAVVRRVRPRIVLTHSPTDYMEDHTNTCRLAVSATFARCVPNFAVKPEAAAYFEDVAVYHAQPHGNCDPLGIAVRPTHFVNLEGVLELKTKMLECHASQKDWLDRTQGMGSYVAIMHTLMKQVGEYSGKFAMAEGWRKHSHLGFCRPEADPLYEALTGHIHKL